MGGEGENHDDNNTSILVLKNNSSEVIHNDNKNTNTSNPLHFDGDLDKPFVNLQFNQVDPTKIIINEDT